jgi:chromosomal replication initiator protein
VAAGLVAVAPAAPVVPAGAGGAVNTAAPAAEGCALAPRPPPIHLLSAGAGAGHDTGIIPDSPRPDVPESAVSARPAPPPSMDAFARRLEAALTARVGAARYALWFRQHATFVPAGGELLVGLPSEQFRDWFGHTFGPAVTAAAAEVFGGAVPVRFLADPELFTSPAAPKPVDPPPEPTKPDPATPRRTLFGEEPPLPPKPPRGRPKADPTKPGRRWRSLGDFVVGACNRVAHASALSAVEDPGQGANPLVFHGPVGTGKTHLLEGIYAGLRKKWPDARPCYVTAEEFTTKFVQAARFGKHGAFRRQFRECSALLLDDLHFLAKRQATQEEFLHTFDALVADGKQVVVTTDCHPRLAEELMPELVDRLLGGAAWSLLPPDDETRLGVLRAKAGGGGAAVPDAVLTYLARHLRGNVRELEGAVNSVRHFAKVTGRPADVSLAREALGDLLRHTVRTVTVADVDAAVCAVLRLSSGVLQSKARSWAVSHPRMAAIYLCRKHTAATYGEIAKHFGAKQHSTAVAAEKKVRGWLKDDIKLALGDREWRAKDLLDRVERELMR